MTELLQALGGDIAKVLVSWANAPAIAVLAFIAYVVRRMLGDRDWLRGDSDLFIPFIVGVGGGWLVEWTTPGFSTEMWVKRALMYIVGVSALFKPALVIAIIPDPLLNLVPGKIGELLRAVSAARADVPNISEVKELLPPAGK